MVSYRRQLSVSADDAKKIPESFRVIHDENSYWIFTSDDILTCFLCKKAGHLARQCPYAETCIQQIPSQQTNQNDSYNSIPHNTQTVQDVNNLQNSYTPAKISTANINIQSNTDSTDESQQEFSILNTNADLTNKNFLKRPALSSISEGSMPTNKEVNIVDERVGEKLHVTNESKETFKKPKSKKKKLQHVKELKENLVLNDSLKIVKEIIEDSPSKYVIN